MHLVKIKISEDRTEIELPELDLVFEYDDSFMLGDKYYLKSLNILSSYGLSRDDFGAFEYIENKEKKKPEEANSYAVEFLDHDFFQYRYYKIPEEYIEKINFVIDKGI